VAQCCAPCVPPPGLPSHPRTAPGAHYCRHIFHPLQCDCRILLTDSVTCLSAALKRRCPTGFGALRCLFFGILFVSGRLGAVDGNVFLCAFNAFCRREIVFRRPSPCKLYCLSLPTYWAWLEAPLSVVCFVVHGTALSCGGRFSASGWPHRSVRRHFVVFHLDRNRVSPCCLVF